MLCSLLRLLCRKMGSGQRLDLILRRYGLIVRRNGFPVIIKYDFLEEHSLQVHIQSLTTASGSRLFGSVIEHWITDPAGRVRFPPKSWEFFSLICYALFFVT